MQYFSANGISLREYDSAFERYELQNTPLGTASEISSSWAELDNSVLLSRSDTHDTFQTGRSLTSDFVVYLPDHSEESYKAFFEHPESTAHGFFLTPDSPAQWHFSGGVRKVLASIDVSELQQHLAHKDIEVLFDAARDVKRDNLNKNALRYVTQNCQQLFTQLTLSNGEYSSKQVDFKFLMKHILMLPLQNIKYVDKRNYRSHLNNAIEYIRQHYNKELTMASLANECNTSVRNIQYIFKKELNISPYEFIQYFRISKFNKSLSRHESVNTCAFMNGLTHPGRAAIKHKEVFALAPKEVAKNNFDRKFRSWLE